jgi:hypothetical protein
MTSMRDQRLAPFIEPVLWLMILPFSGRKRERSDRPVRPTATAC